MISRQGKKIEIRWRDTESRIDDEIAEADSGWQQVAISCHAKPLRILVPRQHPAVRKSGEADNESANWRHS